MEEEETSPPPPAEPSSSGDFSLPRKGILKRPSLRSQLEARDSLAPLPRRSPDRAASASRIPKLSVTWWEKNAVAFFGDTSDEKDTDSEATMAMSSMPGLSLADPPSSLDLNLIPGGVGRSPSSSFDSEFQEDAASVGSSNGSAASSVVGRWWIAKDTRFVPHCEKRGCNHAGHEEGGDYLTPTQRRSKEIAELKKELKKAQAERDEKETHLIQLRARIDNIERLNSEGLVMSERHTTMATNRQLAAAYETEKKALERRHAVRVNQLIRETLVAREEVGRLSIRVAELEANEKDLESREFREAETMTEEELYAMPMRPPLLLPGVAGESVSPSAPLSPPGSLFPTSAPISPTSTDPASMQQYISRETANQLQAYRNEACIWRSKAAQLEIVVREHLVKANEQELALSHQLDQVRRECEGLRDMLRERESEGMADSGIENPASSSPQRNVRIGVEKAPPLPPPTDCTNEGCLETRRVLVNLQAELENMRIRTNDLERRVPTLQEDLQEAESNISTFQSRLVDATKEQEKSEAERAAADMVISRLQTDKETLNKAVTYLEERMQVYQNIILDHELVVQDENTAAWRRGFVDPRYHISVSKRVQTSLTCADLDQHHSDLDEAHHKLRLLDEEMSSKNANLHSRFQEIDANLIAKTKLVDTLSRQLSEAQREMKRNLEKQQQERDEHNIAITKASLAAERIPLLESRVAQLQQENAGMELRVAEAREECEKALEDALAEALKKYAEQSRYWKDKVAGYERQISNAKKEMSQLSREKEEQRLAVKVEKAELERRLTSSIAHVEELSHKLHRPSRDVQCEAKPRQCSKYVACRPHAKTKETQVEKDDLPDEVDERLRVAQLDLSTTKRQLHVLQQKLIATLDEKQEQRFRVRARVASCDASSRDSDSRAETSAASTERASSQRRTASLEHRLRTTSPASGNELEEVIQLRSRNAALREEVKVLEEEKTRLERRGKDKIKQLIREFESLRKELDQELTEKATEKAWLATRIENLESANRQLQATLDGLQRMKEEPPPLPAERFPASAIRKTKSECELREEGESGEAERKRLKAENIALSSEQRRMRQLLQQTADAVSSASSRATLSPALADLVRDLNHVKTDLEKALVELDVEDKAARTLPSILPSTALSSANSQYPEQILETVMTDWNNDEIDRLARDLQRSRQERQALKLRVDRLSRNLRAATTELEMYRKETRTTNADGLPLISKSRSTVDLSREYVDIEECRRWQEKAGTMFRELTRLRANTTQLLAEKRELRVELAMLRGEFELLNCQFHEKTGKSIELPPKDYLRVERGRTARKNSTELPPRPRSGRDSSKERPPGDSFTTSRSSSQVERVSATVRAPSYPATRTRSEERKRRVRSESRKRTGHDEALSLCSALPTTSQSDAAPSGSSLPSIQRRVAQLGMSHSWHCNSEESEEREQRRASRVISLREKVGRLAAQNRQLQEQLKAVEGRGVRTASPVFSASRSATPVAPSAKTERCRTASVEAEIRERTALEIALQQADALRSELQNELTETASRLRAREEELKQQVAVWQSEKGDILPKVEEEKTALTQKLRESGEREADLAARMRLLQTQLELYEKKLSDVEEERKEMYLVMFKKGQQAAAMGVKEACLSLFSLLSLSLSLGFCLCVSAALFPLLSLSLIPPQEGTVDEITEERVVLRFLHDAFYYFLLNKGDSKEHLQAMMTMLNFTPDQREEIAKKHRGIPSGHLPH